MSWNCGFKPGGISEPKLESNALREARHRRLKERLIERFFFS